MSNFENDFVVGERIQGIYKVFIVALPATNDEFLKVSYCPQACIDGTFYYSSNRAATLNATAKLNEMLTPKWAEKHIIGYQIGMKLLPVPAFCDYYYKFDEDKANDRLRGRLEKLTRWEFYNSKW